MKRPAKNFMRPASRLLLIGPMPIAGDVIGGTKVSFANLVRVLGEDERFELSLHDISRPLRGLGRLARFFTNLRSLIKLTWHVLSRASRYDLVMFNTSAGGALMSGPLVWSACRLRGLPLCVRVFGGDLDLFLERTNSTWRLLVERSLLRADLLLVQTQLLARTLPKDCNARWWPTTRDYQANTKTPAESAASARRFLFLSQMRAEKGVAQALAASDELPTGAELHLYGPAMLGFDVATCAAHPKAEYRGALQPAQVPKVLAEHDVLVFASYHPGEGMPGILIEALQAGLPVICSNWRALPEIIQDDRNGLLIEPRSIEELAAAMQRLTADDELYERLSRGALTSGERYRGREWNARLGDWLAELAAPATQLLARRAVHANKEAA